MSDKSKDEPIAVPIRIIGKEYVVACPVGEQASLISSAKQVDGKMRALRRSGKIIGSERIAVITALNLAHELNSATRQVDVIDNDIIKRIDKLQQKAESALKYINSQLAHQTNQNNSKAS
jgi:cell division protein ZapA